VTRIRFPNGEELTIRDGEFSGVEIAAALRERTYYPEPSGSDGDRDALLAQRVLAIILGAEIIYLDLDPPLEDGVE
jgi:hypothetical protein